MRQDSVNLKWALYYRNLGLSVIPVGTGSDGKKPFLSKREGGWKPYQTELAAEKQIQAWWQRWPSAKVGIITGKLSNLTVIDMDSDRGKEAVTEFLPDSLEIPWVKTPHGHHCYFRFTEGVPNKARVIVDTDVRTEGGYIIAPSGNGQYAWLEGCGIHETSPPVMPHILADVLRQGGRRASANSSSHINKDNPYNTNNHSSAHTRGPHVGTANKNQQSPTFANITFSKGGRDNTLFHLANHLVKGGMPAVNIQEYLRFIASRCNPPFPESEIQAKIQSALDRADNRDRNLTEDIREMFRQHHDSITTTFVYNCQHLPTRSERNKANAILSRLVREGFIERVPGVNGVYRRIDKEAESIDWEDAPTDIVEIKYPLDLHLQAKTMPGNIVVVAGTPDAGKSAFALNVASLNMDKFKVHYFSSEMGRSELRTRLNLIEGGGDVSRWRKVNFKERTGNFQDVIVPGEGNLNIIDYYEIYDNFYAISKDMAAIHDKLKGAVALVCVQKDPKSDYGRGGNFGMEKPRIYLNLNAGFPNTAKIMKAKNHFGDNPKEKLIAFKLINGSWFEPIGTWAREGKIIKDGKI